MNKFEELLKQTMGLDGASVGPSTVARAVRGRVLACKLDEARSYWEFVRTSPTEQQALIEAVVVAETWFFRDREAFAAMARIAHQDWLPNHPEGVLRLLSLPCSSGEEPYSMAMALHEAGFPAKRHCIDAVDISVRALGHAQRAVYGKNSFRGVELAFRDRYFEATAHGYRLSDVVRQQVRFQQGNLLAADFLREAETYDMIFCRNLLIYFDRVTQDRAIEALQRLLTAESVLFVGPSEAGLLLSHGLVPAKIPRACAFRKVRAVQRETPLKSAHSIQQNSAGGKIAPPAAGLQSSPPDPVGEIVAQWRGAPAEPGAKLDPGMEDACGLADQGRLVEAAKSCEEHLRMHGPSAQAFHLMGLIRAAAGDLPEAAEYYRKTLYLDPNHQDSLIHLALLLEKQGNAAAAKVLNERVRRLDQREQKQHG